MYECVICISGLLENIKSVLVKYEPDLFFENRHISGRLLVIFSRTQLRVVALSAHTLWNVCLIDRCLKRLTEAVDGDGASVAGQQACTSFLQEPCAFVCAVFYLG